MINTIRDIVKNRVTKFCVDSQTSVRRTVEYMHENNRAAVAVGVGDHIAGVFSERDLLRRVVRKRVDIDSTNVGEVMSSPPHCIPIDASCQTAKAMMLERSVHHLVVLDSQQQFFGFISFLELIEADLSDSRALVRQLNDSYYEPRAVH